MYYEQCKRRKRGPNIGEVNPLENALERDVGLYHKYREATLERDFGLYVDERELEYREATQTRGVKAK